MPSLSPQPLPPDAAQAVAFSTTMTFRLLSRQSCILLGNRGLSDVFKIFGVRAAMQPVKDAQGLVEVTLSGSHHYASLAQQWIIARVAPHCALNFHLSTAEVSCLATQFPPAPPCLRCMCLPSHACNRSSRSCSVPSKKISLNSSFTVVAISPKILPAVETSSCKAATKT